jgi:transcriptional regulator with XRE-family HTH domain
VTALPRTVEDSRAFARSLRRARERAGLTAELLDDLAGLDRGSVERFELTQQRASAGTVLDLAAALRVPASELVRSSAAVVGAS